MSEELLELPRLHVQLLQSWSRILLLVSWQVKIFAKNHQFHFSTLIILICRGTCQHTYQKCHFVTGNTTKDHCQLLSDPEQIQKSARQNHPYYKSHLQDHTLVGLIGICVVVICMVSFIGSLIAYGLRHPNSIAGQMIQSCQCRKVFPKQNNITASQVNLVSNDHNNSVDETSL